MDADEVHVALILCADDDCPSKAHELPGKPWHYHESTPDAVDEPQA